MTCPYDVTSSPSATRATGSILLVSIIDQPSRVRPTKTMKVRSRSTTPNPTGAAPATTAVGPRELLHNPLQARLAPPPMEQLIACELLADPMELLRDRRDRLRAQRDHLAALLEGTDEWSFTLPAGGLCLWLRLHGTTAAALATRAADRGLKLSPRAGLLRRPHPHPLPAAPVYGHPRDPDPRRRRTDRPGADRPVARPAGRHAGGRRRRRVKSQPPSTGWLPVGSAFIHLGS